MISSSTWAYDGPVQRDSKRWVVETHVHPEGEIVIRYESDGGEQARMGARVDVLNQMLADIEFARLTDGA